MNEKRFTIDKIFKEYPKLRDNETECFYHLVDNERNAEIFCERLNNLVEENEQLKKRNKFLEEFDGRAKTVANLKEENEQLRQMIKKNVFGRYREGSLADLEFKAIAYDDIVKVEMSYESEPKVIVICRQGKRENVKSFCQMFIPFGIAYEIIEMIEDE